MKRLIITFAILASGLTMTAQEKFGRTLNLGFGIGYYGYYGSVAPALSLNYEFDLFRNFTLAPFASVSSYRSERYWGNNDNPYRNYYYRETTIPVGAKGTYYFDELFRASDRWDFYAAASVGAAFRTTTWENGYNGDRAVRNYASPLYGNLHVGSECHVTPNFGIFLDLSTGLSTFGLSFHM